MEIEKIIKLLKKMHPDAKCSLDFTTPFELVIAVMLSAQCTDERVNKITPNLFSKYNKPEDFINIDIKILENLIHSCGFFTAKSKNIIQCSKRIVEQYNGQVPNKIEDLITLAGIGRKSANVIMLEAFNNPVGIAVDTHARRVSNRLGLSNETSPEKIEKDLLKIIPKKYYKDVNHLFVWHGRYCCKARKPECEKCLLKNFCEYIHKI